MSLDLRHIRLAYGPRVLLDDACLSLAEGTLAALIGRNGTGKSTLLRVAAGLDEPVAGSVAYDDRPLGGLTPGERARQVAFVATDRLRIPDMRCEEVVALGRSPHTDWIGRLRAEDRAAVDHSLEIVGMAGFERKTMDTLSDGERQRVMIARALAQQTPVLLLDEPTAFLDLPNRYALAALLGRLAHEERKCVLFSTHDLDIALTLADTVALIETPRLHVLPASEMAHSDLIHRLFAGSGLMFDPAAGTVRARKG